MPKKHPHDDRERPLIMAILVLAALITIGATLWMFLPIHYCETGPCTFLWNPPTPTPHP